MQIKRNMASKGLYLSHPNVVMALHLNAHLSHLYRLVIYVRSMMSTWMGVFTKST